jgi:acetylglutamate kinase
MHDLISKAATLLEALPYIQRFSGATFVVKYGGSFMDSPDANVRNSAIVTLGRTGGGRSPPPN